MIPRIPEEIDIEDGWWDDEEPNITTECEDGDCELCPDDDCDCYCHADSE